LLAAFFLFLEKNSLHDLEQRFATAVRKEKLAFERKSRKERFIQRYSEADPYFLDQQIETFPLLGAEKEKLESLLRHPAFPESAAVKERLHFLENNRFAFVESNLHTSAKIKEVEEKLRHPVQMDELDLQRLLSVIEDVPIGSSLPSSTSPQILIKEFKLKKRPTPLQTQVLEVDMELFKREFIQ
jgi:hypothetical protein